MNPATGLKAEWATERAMRRLRDMWAAGDSTQAIGDALGVSKNAIINMRRTLGLPGRANPIIGRPRDALPAPVPKDALPAPVPKDALPARHPKDALPARHPKDAPPARPDRRVAAPRPARAAPSEPSEGRDVRGKPARSASFAVAALFPMRRAGNTEAPVRPDKFPLRRVERVEPCCWVTAPGANGRLPLYCDINSMPGLPYCTEHAMKAYPAVKRRADSASCERQLGEHVSMGGDD